MIILGVTGNTGSGKSSACKILECAGAIVLDADKISRIVMKKGYKCHEEVVNFFGESILDSSGEIIRKRLGEIVFADRSKLSQLEKITHKHIIEHIKEKISIAKDYGTHNLIVLDAPLLIESGLNEICQEVWLIDAPYENKIKRIMDRDNLSRQEAELRFSKQSKVVYLAKFSDTVIHNDADEQALQNKVKECLNQLLKKFNTNKIKGDN